MVLETLGVFRVAGRRSLVDACFDGHAFSANRVLSGLERQGVIRSTTVQPPARAGRSRPQHGYQVFSLTGVGRDLVARRRRKSETSVTRAVSADDQRFWAGDADLRQLRHDHQVFDAVVKEAEEVRSKGSHIRRVRLESELRGLLSAAEYVGRTVDGASGARQARSDCARSVGLRVFDAGVPLPDAVIEIEHRDGSVTTRSIEVTTGQYSVSQVSAKRDAGFRLYSFPIPSWRSEKPRRAGGGSSDWKEFPLSWGR